MNQKTNNKPPKWGEIINGKRRYPTHFYQKKALNSNSRTTFCFAGTGGGKSCIIPLWLLQRINEQPKNRILVVSPTYKLFKQSKLLDAFKEAIEGTIFVGKYHKTDFIYTCGSGAEIFFRSAEVPDSLEGGQYGALAIDEVAKLSKDAWIKASARVGASQGPILAVGTPDANTWIYDDIFTKATFISVEQDDGSIRISPDGTLKVIQWHSSTNPIYSKEEIAKQKQELRPEIFARRYLGEFSKLDGLVYPEFSQSIVKSQQILPSPSVRVVAGLDWGWNDPTSVLVLSECQDGYVYVVEEIYESHLPLDRLAEKLHLLKKKWNIETFFCDHSRPEIRDQLYKTGLNCQIKNVASIETGVSMVDARIRNGALKVFDSCHNLITESRQYARKTDKSDVFSEKPVDKNNHLMDALRYAVTGLDLGRRLTFTKAQPTEKESLEAMVRLSRMPVDEKEQQRIIVEKRRKQLDERFFQLAWGDLED